MTAENLAKVVADIRAGRVGLAEAPVYVEPPAPFVVKKLGSLREIDIERSHYAVVIDAQRFYEQVTTKTVDVYAHNLMPVWENALVTYENDYGNVNVASVVVYPFDEQDPWETDNPVEWDRVGYVYYISAYLGGRSSGGPVGTQGPLYLWRIAVYTDGEIADILWQNVLNFRNNGMFNNLILAVLKSYDLGNCVNVELAVPTRPRAQRRRVERTGVILSEIHVRSISKTYRNDARGPALDPGVPLSSVRGHHAHYGPKYGRKLLFNKYEGRFWIPQHVRGNERLGVVEEQIYVVEDA